MSPSVPWKYAASNLLVIWLYLLIYRTNHYFVGFLSDATQWILLGLGIAFSGWSVFCYCRPRDPAPPPPHTYVAIAVILRWLGSVRRDLLGMPHPDLLRSSPVEPHERSSMLFLLVKFIYLPMMIEFLVGNWKDAYSIPAGTSELHGIPPVLVFNQTIFPMVLTVFFMADTALYAFGYLFESPRLNNKLRSVEPTVLGWAVTLACYPPNNKFVNTYVDWYSTDQPQFDSSIWLTFAARAAILLLFVFYVWGAASLGTRCSNLTNRGIVTTGAFGVVRHPAYICKNLAWWIGFLPHISIPGLLTMIFWSGLYFLRAITEERHLSMDPEYQDYCRKVRWRFIPGVF